MKKGKSKAFTLTELLVVVVVIGVLSAVVLPKFSKVIETRRTTEAEELMASIRTEQERRCALDKKYITDDISRLNDIVKNPDTKNYTLTLASTGINAKRKDKDYTLEMPSYADGRICCRGEACEGLNKNYPNCNDFTYELSPDSCAGEATPVEPAVIPCSGSSSQSCGCQSKGTQTRTCDTATGTWSAWSACSISDECECEEPEPDSVQPCNGCGEQTRSVTCNTQTGVWVTGDWSDCSKAKIECNTFDKIDPIEFCRKVTSANWSNCCADKPLSDSACYQFCQEKKTTTSGSGSEGGDLATNPYFCDDLKEGEWRRDMRCDGASSHPISGICQGMRICGGFAYVPVEPPPPGATLTPVEGGGSSNTSFAMEYYMCAAGEQCSKSCRGFHDGWVSQTLVVNDYLKTE